MNGAPVELIEQRTANSKTFLMPNGRIGLDVSIGAIHYKDNYQDQTEQWKDIDCAIQPDGTIRKAPYDLDIDLNAIGFRCRVKEDGSEFTMGLESLGVDILPRKVKPIISSNQVIWRDVAPDTDIAIVAEETRISFRRILKSNLASVRAEFNVTKPSKSIAVLKARARDADGEEVPVEVAEDGGKLVERIDVRGKKFPIEIDPTLDLQVGASSDDAHKYWNGSAWVFSTTHAWVQTGYTTASLYKDGGGMRFLNVAIPQGATISTAYFSVKCLFTTSVDTVNTIIAGEDVDEAATFSDIADYDGRTKTAATVNWNAIPGWTIGTWYNSPEIKTIIQEIVDRVGWVSGNALVIFWDDHDDNSSHVTNAFRGHRTYDESPAYAPKLHIEYVVTEKTSSDAGSGADAYVSLETGVAKSSSDAGSGVESTPVPSATLAGSETGSGIEAFVARLLAAFDAGTGAEVGGLLKDLLVSELGRGSDSLIAKIETPTKGGGMKLWT